MNMPKKELHKFFFKALELLVKFNGNVKLEEIIFNPIMLKGWKNGEASNLLQKLNQNLIQWVYWFTKKGLFKQEKKA